MTFGPSSADRSAQKHAAGASFRVTIPDSVIVNNCFRMGDESRMIFSAGSAWSLMCAIVGASTRPRISDHEQSCQ